LAVLPNGCWRDRLGVEHDANRGIEKARTACKIALKRKLVWLWVDTVCIDKTNNVELSEAINSMWRWYYESALCLVYLEDITHANCFQDFGKSEWFKRGWTLQELIAPGTMVFFGSDWSEIGTRATLEAQLSAATGIPHEVLNDRSRVFTCSVAQKMSWAAQRSTTRPEDMAYCLLGLFSINMELLYGEGAKNAFRRLQMRILEVNEDESIFAWTIGTVEDEVSKAILCIAGSTEHAEIHMLCAITGILATEPKHFARSGSVMLEQDYFPEIPSRITSRGVDMTRQVAELHQVGIKAADFPVVSNHGVFVDPEVQLLAVPISYSDDFSSEHTFVLVAEDVGSRPVQRWCRVHVPGVYKQRLKSMASVSGYTSLMNPLFVRVSWPAPFVYRLTTPNRRAQSFGGR